ncbi:hypothetical protein DYB30_005402 [Aphanomyces astaci]|uniref:FAD-binding domain-containing protein n=1 Tax=Aphanomyces astaci TaxID=112090 RepID=A0A397D2I5_APHAT|nr:hypothetical protein DYB30_005402 [Aphanomyces astaci]
MGKFIVVGSGPVGCLAALQLAHQGHTVTLYEGRGHIPTDPSQSYPIGVNPRGLHAIESVAPDVAQRIRSEGHVIAAWEIYAGPRRVAKQVSGVVYGTSRGNVNLHLWNACTKCPHAITLRMNHRLQSMDFAAKTLTFETTDGSVVVVDAADARVVGADGVHSTVRTYMQQADATFLVTVTPWANEYRVLFGRVGQPAPGLDPSVHYIFSGGYTATIDNGGAKQWTLVTTMRDSDDAGVSSSQLVRETDASEANVAKLKAWVHSIAPAMVDVLSPHELVQYFSRRTYRGAVVECSKFDVDEWVVLVGDAAHSVLPPTGEGINSGLEDTLVLAAAVGCTAGASSCFAAYTKARMPDIAALWTYATHLNASPSFLGERLARLVFLIAESKSHHSIGQSLFGPMGIHRWPYKRIVDKWAWRRLLWINAARVLTYPLSVVAWVLCLPFKLARSTPTYATTKSTFKLQRGVV